MQFEKLPPDSEFDCRIVFDEDDEAKVISAVYTEHITKLARLGNIGSIQMFDRVMSEYAEQVDGNGNYPARKFRNASRLCDMVQEFHENTGTAAAEIALESSIPAYDNVYVAERLGLGESALDLLEKLQQETIVGEAVRKLDEMPGIDSEFGR